MLTDIQVINHGLSKIASSRISQINPPKTNLEAYMAVNYRIWKREELSKRRWVFALEKHYQLTAETILTDVDRPYKYRLPNDCLRPLRGKGTEWIQAGRYIFSSYSTLFLDYIRDVPESDFDALFEPVIACKVALESAEYVTQSLSKKQFAASQYEEAVVAAAKANAFIIGPETTGEDDATFSWLTSRYTGQQA